MAIIGLTDSILFDGVNLLSVAGWRTTGTDTYRYPKRDVKVLNLASSNDTATTSAFYAGRSINVRGVIARSSRELLDASITELKRILEKYNKTLELPISGERRQFYKTTVTNIMITDVGGGFAKIDIELATTEPFNYEITSTTLLNVANLTSGNKSYPVTVDGSADQAPLITYTVDSFTTGTNRTVTFNNPITGLSLSIERTWTAAEVMIIDCKNKTITINGVAIDATGNFPVWAKGAGFINYIDNFTARQVDILVTYIKRYY